MKMTRGQAIGFHSALGVIAQGQKGAAPDLPMKTYLLIVTMLNCLSPVREAFEKASAAGFRNAAGDAPASGPDGQAKISDPKKALQYQADVQELLGAEINVKMPKEKLAEADLKIKENGIPAGLIAQIAPLIKFSTGIELEDDETVT